jgi:hypothetical protein
VDQVEVLRHTQHTHNTHTTHTTHNTQHTHVRTGPTRRRATKGAWCGYEVRDLEVLEGVVDGLDRTLRLVVVVEHLARDEELLTADGWGDHLG